MPENMDGTWYMVMKVERDVRLFGKVQRLPEGQAFCPCFRNRDEAFQYAGGNSDLIVPIVAEYRTK
jgi:hypothetical protein